MPVPKNRSNSVRTIKYRTPSGKSAIRYRRRVKGGKQFCAVSGDLLTGTHATRSLKPSMRRPERPFGGRLSPSVARRVTIFRSRLAQGLVTVDDVPVALLPYVKDVKKQ
jgi:large subunit ribosomal protein L34e